MRIDLPGLVRSMWDGAPVGPEPAPLAEMPPACSFPVGGGLPISVEAIPVDRPVTLELRDGRLYLLGVGRTPMPKALRYEYHPDAADERPRR